LTLPGLFGTVRPVSDLIGTKRPSHARSVRTWMTIAVLLSVSLVIAYLLYRRVSSYAHPDGKASGAAMEVDATNPEGGLRYGPAQLRYYGPLAVLHTEGNPHQIGVQHGRLLAQEIRKVQEVFQDNVEQTVSTAGLFGESLHNIRLRWRWQTR
jgi:hypothetical protein